MIFIITVTVPEYRPIKRDFNIGESEAGDGEGSTEVGATCGGVRPLLVPRHHGRFTLTQVVFMLQGKGVRLVSFK